MPTLSPDQRNLICDLYQEGNYTQSAIAQKLGTTQGNVSKIIASANLPKKAPRPAKRQPRVYLVSQIGRGDSGADLDYM